MEDKDIILRAIAEQAYDSIIVTDTNFLIIYVNKSALDVFGYTEEELVGRTPDFLNAEPLSESIQQDIYKTVSEGKVWKNTLLNKRKDGSLFFIDLSISPLRNNNGEIFAYVSIQRNVTDRKLEEDDLRISEDRFLKAQKIARIGFWDWKIPSDELFWSDEVYRAFGFDVGGVVPSYKSFLDAVHLDDRELVSNSAFAAINNGESYDLVFRAVRPNGKIRYIATQGEVIRDKIGAPIRFIGIHMDITERKTVEIALQNEKNKFQSMLDALSDGLTIRDLNYNLLYQNKLMLELHGNRTGEKCYKAFEGRDSVCEGCPAALSFQDGLPHTVTRTHKSPNGETIHSEVSSSPIRDAAGAIVSCLEITRNITERKLNEEYQKLRQEQEKLALVGRIAGKMAHDFNNLLGIIVGTTDLLLMEPLPADVRKDIEVIMGSALRGKNITSNLLLFAKDQELKFDAFNLKENILNTLRGMKSDLTNIDVETDFDDEIDVILADPSLMGNALANLLSNAVHALSKTERPRVRIRTFRDDKNAFVEVCDNGCGIPREHVDDIFLPAFTLKGSHDRIGAYKKDVRGSGYGLTNVKRCADKHGGTIHVKSENGEGATVVFSIPIIRGELEAESLCAARAPEFARGKRILIVEDEPHLGKIMRSLLNAFDHDVHFAADGKAALEFLKNHEYDAVSLDYILPDMSGLDIYRAIRAEKKDLPVIFVSGNFEFIQSMLDLKKEDRRVDHLAKPFENMDYIKTIHRWLSR